MTEFNNYDLDTFLKNVDFYNQKIADTDFSDETRNVLEILGYTTLAELSNLSEEETKRLKDDYFGAYKEVYLLLSNLGIKSSSYSMKWLSAEEKKQCYKLEYPYNFLNSIYGVNWCEECNWQNDYSHRLALSIALNLLPSREFTILILRYRYRLTYKRIGEIYNVSQSFIKDYLHKTERYFRQQSKHDLIKFGFSKFIDNYIEEKATVKFNVFKEGFLLASTGDDIKTSIKEKKSIEDLNLSNRTTNCLKNAGIRTLSELVSKTEGDLVKTRNFGKHSLREINEKLAELGLKLAG